MINSVQRYRLDKAYDDLLGIKTDYDLIGPVRYRDGHVLNHFNVGVNENIISIDIPSNFSVIGVREFIIGKLKEIELDLNDFNHDQQILFNDDAMMKEFGKISIYRRGKWIDTQRAVVRASTYVGKSERFCLLQGYRRDPRCPVLMRGSKEAMQSKYNTKSAMGETIAERYLRYIKFTCLSRQDMNDNKIISNLSRRLHENGWYLHHGLSHLRCDESRVWVNGELRNTEDKDVTIMIIKYQKRMAERKDHQAKAVRRAYEQEQARKTWLLWQQERENRRQNKQQIADMKHKETLAAKRQKKINELAAMELLTEMGILKNGDENA